MSILDGWAVMRNRYNRFLHIVPMNDCREHEFDKTCWCRPEVDDDEDRITHHAMDGREAFEHIPPQ